MIGHIRQCYPNLGPALNQLVERLDQCSDNELEIRDLERQIEIKDDEYLKLRGEFDQYQEDHPKIGKCAHCGSVMEFSSPQK